MDACLDQNLDLWSSWILQNGLLKETGFCALEITTNISCSGPNDICIALKALLPTQCLHLVEFGVQRARTCQRYMKQAEAI